MRRQLGGRHDGAIRRRVDEVAVCIQLHLALARTELDRFGGRGMLSLYTNSFTEACSKLALIGSNEKSSAPESNSAT